MKKVYVIQNLNFAAPYPGNLMRSIWNLEKRCKAENIEFIYCFPEIAKHIPWVEEMIRQGSVVYFKQSKNNCSIWRKIIKEYCPIAIHTHFWNLRDALMIRLVNLFNNKTRLILHHHNTYFESKKRWKELVKRIIIKSDVHIACGISVGEKLKKSKFKNVVTVENAIDYSRLDNYTALSRKDFDIDNDAAVFFMFGHEIRRKGVDIAVKAINNLNKEKKAVLCVIVASNLDKAKQELSAKFKEIPECVKFLPPRDDIATYYHFADVFLSPSREEGFCYALPEAAYCGCKIVFSDIEGQMHAADIPNSISFESENIESLQRQLENVLKIEKSNTAKEYVYDRYNLSKWSEEITNIYRSF